MNTGSAPQLSDGVGGCDESQRGDDDFVSFRNVESQQREVQRGGTGIARYGVSMPQNSAKLVSNAGINRPTDEIQLVSMHSWTYFFSFPRRLGVRPRFYPLRTIV